MNRGDKVVCMNSLLGHSRRYILGNVYEVGGIDSLDNSVYILSETSYDNQIILGLWFNIDNIASDNYYMNFCDYFITLAEWRDKQINSILNE